MSYAYQAEFWCDSCGEKIIEDLRSQNVENSEDTRDTDDFPQYFDGSIAESDCPCHCASGSECLEIHYKYDYSGVVMSAIVCDILTDIRKQYVLDALKKETPCSYEWAKYFDIQYSTD